MTPEKWTPETTAHAMQALEDLDRSGEWGAATVVAVSYLEGAVYRVAQLEEQLLVAEVMAHGSWAYRGGIPKRPGKLGRPRAPMTPEMEAWVSAATSGEGGERPVRPRRRWWRR